MMAGSQFHRTDVEAAGHFGLAAKRGAVRRIIYLGGLGNPEESLSPHLESRQKTGEALRQGGVAVTEFRAAVVVGAGSLSFEMVRYLTEHLPVMICPRWVYTRIQPIAIEDCLDYLEQALTQPRSEGRIIEIGGDEILTYAEMMTRYAEVRGLRRAMLPVPVLTPRLSSYWVHLVTPISANVAQPLIEGLRNEVIVREDSARRLFPHIEPMDYTTAVRSALRELRMAAVDRDMAELRGSDSLHVKFAWRRGMILEHRKRTAEVSAARVFKALSELGGDRGWLYMNWVWRLRGAIDRVLGGVGLRARRGTMRSLRVGDTVDFWTVEELEPNRRLRLRADMKLPGEAWLEFAIAPVSEGQAVLHQTAIYAPKGLLGLAYWVLLYPIHSLIFDGLLRNLVRRAGSLAAEEAVRLEGA